MPIQSYFKPINEKNSYFSASLKLKKDGKRFASSNFVNRTVNNNHVNIVGKLKSLEQPSVYSPRKNFSFR